MNLDELFKINMSNKKDKAQILFYQESNVILEEFKELKVPKNVLLDVLKIVKNLELTMPNLSNTMYRFIQDSYRLKNKVHSEVEHNIACDKNVTFEDLNEKQLTWYFYWRSCVLNQVYLEVDKNYIELFIHELANYSFNEKACFNLSVIKKLYENYQNEHNLEWVLELIGDLLVEAGNEKLAGTYLTGDKEIKNPILYEQLSMGELKKIPIEIWKKYMHVVSVEKSDFFQKNHDEIYKNFQECIPLLERLHIQENGMKIRDLFFEEQNQKVEKILFKNRKIFRTQLNYILNNKKRIAYPRLYKELHAYVILTENVTRILHKEGKQLKYDKSLLPVDLRSVMLQHLMKQQQVGRFKVVKLEEDIVGSAIPLAPIESVAKESPLTIDYDENRIKQLEEQNQSLVEMLADNDIQQPDYLKAESFIEGNEEQNLEQFLNSVEKELTTEIIREFISCLDSFEKNTLNLFNEELKCEKQKLGQYATENNTLPGLLISSINEKAQLILNDNLIEEEFEILTIYEDYEDILKQVEGILNEH